MPRAVARVRVARAAAMLLAAGASFVLDAHGAVVAGDSTRPPHERFGPWRESRGEPLSPAALHAWSARHAAMRTEGAATSPPWVAFDTGIESVSGLISGRVSTLRFGPGVDGAHTMWIGASSGGVWEFDSAAQRWHARSTDLVGSPGVGDFVFADVMVLATGDPWRYPGSGIYRREPAGWSLAMMPAVPSSVYRLAVDRDDDQHLFAATPIGLWRSNDGGRSWQTLRSGHFTDVLQDPFVADRWYAGAWDVGVLRSTNGGQSFATANGATIGAPIGRVSLAANTAQANLVFALVADFGNTRGVFRSTDAASTWASIDGGPDVGWGQAFHTNTIASHPSNPNLLLVAQGGAKLTRDALAATPTWVDIGGTGHADTTRLAWDADGQLWASNDGGVRRLDLDAGTTDGSRNTGLSTLQVFAPGALASDPNGIERAWIGLQDAGLVRAELSVPRLVLGIACCDGGWVSAARGVANRVAAMLGIPFSPNLSNNAGASFSRLCMPETQSGNWPVAFDPSPDAGSAPLLYMATQAPGEGPGFLRRLKLSLPCAQASSSFSIPDAATFRPDFLSIAHDPTRVVLFISPTPGAPDRRYAIGRSPVGLREGSITIERRAPPLDRDGYIAADPARIGRVWWFTVNGSPRVMRSDAHGDDGSWVDATGNLVAFGTELRIRRVLGHPGDPDLVHLASSLGFLASRDGGAHWTIEHPGLPAVVDVVDVAVQPVVDAHPPATRVWLATYGHGLWRREIVDDFLVRDGFE